MRQATLFIILLSLAFHCSGQNKTNKDGLLVGLWTDQHMNSNGKCTERGSYKVIPINTYDSIGSLNRENYEFEYKGANYFLSFSGKSGDSISVKDSLWQGFDSLGNISYSKYWQEGLQIWSKSFDPDGNMTEHNYYDFDKDTGFVLSYVGKHVYRKLVYPLSDRSERTETFYPDNDLEISDTEPMLDSYFGQAEDTFVQLRLSCKKDLTIYSVSSSSANLQVTFPSNALPFKLTTKDTVSCILTYRPTPTAFREYDTITIVTSEVNSPPYKIYCTMYATHIDGGNIHSGKEVSVSKSKDKFFYITSMGTVTTAYFRKRDSEETEKEFSIFRLTQIDLNELEVGDYDLSVLSCDAGGFAKVKITE